LERMCLFCGKKFKVFPYEANERRFCSATCFHKYLDRHRKIKTEKVVSLFNEGNVTLTEIARKLNCCVESIRKHLKKAGVFNAEIIKDRARQRLSEVRKKNNPMKNAESVEKLRESARKVWLREDYRESQSRKHKGKKHNPRTIEKIRIWMLTHPEVWYGKLSPEEWLKRTFKSRNVRPTSLEKRLMEICESHNLPYRYVGDGSLWIGGLNPDFIHNEKNVVVEVLGRYWHSNEEAQERAHKFRNCGFECITIWEEELCSSSDEDIVRRLLT
jgi:very-short-patch-repair endonuclease